MPGDVANERRSPHESSGKKGRNSADSSDQAPSYYDISMLKPPVWKWEVAAYFFLGGLSAGAYILSRLAERFGGPEQRDARRAGAAIAALAALPCAPLLIIDLGDKKRFHHMLRVWKPKSPMNLGSWTLTAYTGMAMWAVLREWAQRHEEERSVAELAHAPAQSVLDKGAQAALDGAGVPLALLLATYTGLLLSGTANPVWSRNRWLSPLFMAGAMSTGAAAISLVLEASSDAETPAKATLQKVETAARIAEAVTLTGYLQSLGDLAAPITRGKLAPHLWGVTVGGGIALPELLESLPVGGKARRWLKLTAAFSSLIGGFALRWAVLYAGHESANDPEAARQASRPK